MLAKRWTRLVGAAVFLGLALLLVQLKLGSVEQSLGRLQASTLLGGGAEDDDEPDAPILRPRRGRASAGDEGEPAAAGRSSAQRGQPTGLSCFKQAIRTFRVKGQRRLQPFEVVGATRCVISLRVNTKFTYMGPQGSALPLMEFDMCQALRLVEELRERPSLYWDGERPRDQGCDWRSVKRALGNYTHVHDMYTERARAIKGGTLAFDGEAHRARFKRYASCALVGGAPSLLGADYGRAIDAHEAVVRFNDHPAGGPHAAQVGSRTTHRITNCVYASTPVNEQSTVEWMRPSRLNGTQIVQVCTRHVRFKKAVLQIVADGPAHRHVVSPDVLCGFYDHFQTGGLTGAIGVWYVLGMCDSVSLFGFSSPCDLGRPYSHYHSADYDELIQVNTVKVILWTHALRCAGLVHWAVPSDTADTCGAARTLTAQSAAPPLPADGVADKGGGSGGGGGGGGGAGAEQAAAMWALPSSFLEGPGAEAGGGDSADEEAGEEGEEEGGGGGNSTAPLGEGVTRSASEALSLPASAWRLHTYAIPFEQLGVPADVVQRYKQAVAAEHTPAGFDEGGMYSGVVRELQAAMRPWQPPAPAAARRRAAWAGQNVLYLLPLSPYHYCMAAEPQRQWGAPWMGAKGVLPVHVADSVVAAYADGLASMSLSCNAFERVLRWLYAQPGWRAAPERHVFVHAMPHLPRIALESDVRRLGRAASVYARMGHGILVGAEDRRHDWQAAAYCGRLVLAPLYSPPFFFLAPEVPVSAAAVASAWQAEAGESGGGGGDEGGGGGGGGGRAAGGSGGGGAVADDPALSAALASKSVLVAASHFAAVKCHRFDDPAQPTAWSCADFGAARARAVRGAVSAALAGLARAGTAKVADLPTVRKSTASAHALAGTLAQKAAAYRSAVFCVIAAGDTVVTARLYSAAAALCIPVVLFPLSFLPFAKLVPWANISLSLSPQQFVAYAASPRTTPNPLLALVRLAREEPARLRAMQRALADARWLLHYQSQPLPGRAANSSEPPSAGSALAHHLVLAAKQRVRAEAAGLENGSCGKETLGDVTIYRR